MKRNKIRQTVRRPTGTSFARAVGFTKENVSLFFDNIEGVFNEKNYPPNRIFNADESGLTELSRTSRRSQRKNTSRVTYIFKEGIVVCMSAMFYLW